MHSVSIHVPARGTTKRVACLVDYSEVSIHVPARGTTSVKGHMVSFQYVSIHVPARGTTKLIKLGRLLAQFQSTFPHGERPQETAEKAVETTVSIHVPARGTTFSGWNLFYSCWFQSTFPHGERQRDGLAGTCCPGFNPRSRTGNDAVIRFMQMG